jgi:hypothetical protein
MNYTLEQLEALTNWDGMLCKPPFANAAQEAQYYSRFLTQRLWKYLSLSDWKRIREIFNNIKLPEKTKRAVAFILERKEQDEPANESAIHFF